MDRKTIEEKDKNLLKEVRRIVRTNQTKTKIAKPFWRTSIFWTAVLFILIIGIGLTAFRQKPTMVASKNETSTSDIRIEDTPSSTNEISTKQFEMADAEPRNQSAEELENKVSAASETQNERPGNPPGPVSPEKTPTVTPSGKKADTAALIRESFNIRIRKIVTCTGINEHQYLLERSTFSLKETVKPTVWMSVQSDTQPFTLTHVYSLNGHRYCEVPLTIRYPRTRTWSHVTLLDDKQLGHWRVEVLTDDGDRLAEAEFMVVP